MTRDIRYGAFIVLAALFLLFLAVTYKAPRMVRPGPGSQSGAVERSSASVATNFPGFPIDLNTATREDLTILPGIGGATADRVIALREASGGFSDISELLQVKWFGPAKLKGLAHLVTVGSAPAQTSRN